MNDILMTIVVVVVLAGVTAAVSTSYPRAMRSWVWLAFAEYLACAVAQIVYLRVGEGGDATYYGQIGGDLAKFLDTSFGWSAHELLAMLFQQPSRLDPLIFTPESNSGSMVAATAFLLFFLRGSVFAAHVMMSGLSFFGALGIYRASTDAYPQGSPVRMFMATVLFPSVAFWTSSLHKEAFALAGIGTLLTAWRCVYKRQLRALVYAPIGLVLILLFRAPALPPLLLGLVAFTVWERLQKSRGADVVVLGPVYAVGGAGVLLLGMIAVSRASPALALDRLAETVATSQNNWSLVAGGSSFAEDAAAPLTLGGQLLRLPLALVNALFRPQLFDVHNIATFVSALEMMALTYFIYRAIRHHGLRGIFVRIQRSPFLLMCAVITCVGCAMVGLVTFNFGSLARYRVPFLPFYGALVAALLPARAPVPRVAPPARRLHGSARRAARQSPARRPGPVAP